MCDTTVKQFTRSDKQLMFCLSLGGQREATVSMIIWEEKEKKKLNMLV